MRLKVILFMLTLGLLGGLSACSSEEPIDSQTLDMSLVLLMGDIQTKAPATNYDYATTEEITIQNCHVAVFDAAGNRIHFQDFEIMGDMQTIDNLSGYELGLVGVRTFGKEDKALSVLVVANANNSLFNDCATYADYTSKTIQTTSFQSSRLVKIGKSDATLRYNAANEAIKVSLIQLSAKIKYIGIYNKNSNDLINDQFSLTNVQGLNASSQVAIFKTSSVENGAFEALTYPLKDKPTTFYTYEISDANKEIVLSVQQDGSKEKSFSFSADKFIKGNYYEIKGLYEPSTEIEWVLKEIINENIILDPFK